MTVAVHNIGSRVAAVRARIETASARAGRDPAAVTLIAVSKTQPAEAILEAWREGVRDFGENYVQEALAKVPEVRQSAGTGPRFHFIGHLQRNKARAVVGPFAILHTIDSEGLLDAIAAAAPREPVSIMLQVNVAAEPTKGGVLPPGLGSLVQHARSLNAVQLLGLMAVPPANSDPEASRPVFRELRRLAETHALKGLSMGMTGDFEVAIEEGATHVRVGRAIFGERTV
jgi:hypothetical protein